MIVDVRNILVKEDFRLEKCRGYCSEYHMESLTLVGSGVVIDVGPGKAPSAPGRNVARTPPAMLAGAPSTDYPTRAG